MHARAEVAGDLRGGVGGMRVDHDDFVAERQRGDAVADAVGFVERDNAGRERACWRRTCAASGVASEAGFEEALMADYLLFASERYALPILQPLAQALQAAGHGVHAWFVDGAAGAALPSPVRMIGLHEAVALKPRAVFSAANWVPTFVSGAKVQLFHGFNVEKRSDERGHFRVRGLFDLYCTQGPATTAPFQALAARGRPFRRGRDRLAQARPAVPRRRRRRRGLARAGRRAAGGDVRLHLHRAPERGAAPVRRDRRGGRTRRPLLAADPASQVPAGAVRALSRAGRRRMRPSSRPSSWSPRSARPTCCWPTRPRWCRSSSCSASRW